MDAASMEKVRLLPRVSFVIGTRDTGLLDLLANGEEDRLRQCGLHHRIIQFDGGHHIDPPTLLKLAERGPAN
jgi:hypothetical protein